MGDPLPRTSRRFVLLTALRWLPTGLTLPVTVLLLQARGLSLPTVGVVMSVYGIVTATLELPTGGLADVIGRRPVLLGAATLTAVGTALLGLGQDVPVLAFGSGVLGLARALDSGPLQAWYVDAVHAVDPSADLRPGLSRASSAEALGLGVGALASGGLVTVAPFPARDGVLLALSLPLAVSALMSLVQVATVAAWVHDPPVVRRPRLGAVLGEVPRTVRRGLVLAAGRGPLRRLTALSLALGVALAGVEILSPAAFAALLGGESAAAGPYALLVTIAFFGTAAGAALAPLTARAVRSSSRALVLSCLLAAGSLLAFTAPTLGVAAAAYVAFYVLMGVRDPLAADLTHRAVPSAQRATVLSVQSMALQVSGVAATLGLTALAGATSLAVSFAVIAVAIALGGLACVAMPSARQEPTRPVAQPAR